MVVGGKSSVSYPGLFTPVGRAHGRLRLKCDGTRAETRFPLSAKRTSPFKSVGGGASVQSTTGSRGARISGSNAGRTMFRGSVKGTGYPFHSPVSPSLPLPCVTECHHISTVQEAGLASELVWMLWRKLFDCLACISSVQQLHFSSCTLSACNNK
jgi:hypothetical protein